MQARCTSFIATSLDGFIARPDGAIDWLDQANRSIPEGEDCGYADYMAGIDAIVLGRHTFETVLAFNPWPYGDTPVYVLSTTLRSLPATAPPSVNLHQHCSPADLAALAWRHDQRRLHVDGGRTIQGFLAAGLLAEITITVIPVLLGAGRPLFSTLPAADLWLTPLASRAYPFGFVQTHWAIQGSA